MNTENSENSGRSEKQTIHLEVPDWAGKTESGNSGGVVYGDGLTDLSASSAPEESKQETGKSAADRIRMQVESLLHRSEEKPGPEDAKPDRSSEWQIRIILAGLLALAVLGSLAASLFYRQAQFYKDHFREGTTVNGMDVSDKTVEEVEAALEKKALDYSLTLNFRGGKTELLNREAFAYTYVSDGSVAALMEEQDAFHWHLGLKKRDTVSARMNTEYDEDTLRESLDALPELKEKNMKAPVDACRVWDDKEHAFVIIPEEEGSLLDKEAVFEAACSAIEQGEKTLDVEEIKDAYANPEIRKDDARLNQEVEQLNELAGASITWETPNGEVVLDGETLQNWLKQDEDGNYTKNMYAWQMHIRGFVAELASSVDSFGKNRMFSMSGGGETEIDGNDYYGWEMDQEREITRLALNLSRNKVATIEPFYLFEEAAPMDDHDGVGDTYVEVDLSRQHLWMYVDGKQILETDVVSGMMSTQRHTPEGIFYPLSLQRNAVLRGSSGGETWVAPVNYWMKLTNDGVGLHDATWRYSFGGDIYIYGGSHGCINLPLDAAQTIFENLTYEMPVVVYYSDPYELF